MTYSFGTGKALRIAPCVIDQKATARIGDVVNLIGSPNRPISWR
jgi:hypothetical protein